MASGVECNSKAASVHRGGRGISRIARVRASLTARTLEIFLHASRIPHRCVAPPEACAINAATSSRCKASASGSDKAASECGAAARYSGLPTKKSDPLRRSGAAQIGAEFVPRIGLRGRVNEHQIVQIGAPPSPRFHHVGRAIHLDTGLSHYVGAQVALRLRSVQQQYALLFCRNVLRYRNR